MPKVQKQQELKDFKWFKKIIIDFYEKVLEYGNMPHEIPVVKISAVKICEMQTFFGELHAKFCKTNTDYLLRRYLPSFI